MLSSEHRAGAQQPAGELECSAEPAAAVRSITATPASDRPECTFTLAPNARASRVLLRASIAGLEAVAVVSVWHIEDVRVAQQWLFEHPQAVLKRIQRVQDCDDVASECAAALLL